MSNATPILSIVATRLRRRHEARRKLSLKKQSLNDFHAAVAEFDAVPHPQVFGEEARHSPSADDIRQILRRHRGC